MKKLVTFFLSAFLVTAILTSSVSLSYASDITSGISLNVNGQRTLTDVPPIIKSGRTFIPIRSIFEKLGASVQWIGTESKIIVTYKSKSINLWINKNQATVNGIVKKMDAVPFIQSGRTMLPVRFIAENLGMRVQWYGPASLVTVTEPSFFSNLETGTVLGFTTNDYSGDNYSYNSVVANANNLDSIATFSYHFDTNGKLLLAGKSQQNTVNFVNSNDIKPLVLIHNLVNHAFDSSLAHAVLSSSYKRKALINNVLLMMSKEQYSGVNIDIENLNADDRPYYSAFIKELKEKLTPFGYLTTVSIPAKTSDMKSSRWSGGFDYSYIGKYADRILLMTYDEHYFGGSAGPIASAPWVKKVLDYATSVIPSKKILLGIAGYGYDWSSKGNSVVTYKGVEKVLSENLAQSQWDDTAKSPFYNYTKDGVQHVVWYENSQSVGVKLDMVQQYKLGGIGLWKLGFDNQNFWSVISQKLG